MSAPLIHDPDFERFPSRFIEATCYERDHRTPAPACRCGLYAPVEGTLDSLSGYLKDSAHDLDPCIYAEVACTGRVFLDARGVRAQKIEILKLATSSSSWPSAEVQKQVTAALGVRYGVDVFDLTILPEWLIRNVMSRGVPGSGATIDLKALEARIRPPR